MIKIDDPTRVLDPVGYIDVNRGKRSIMLNLKTEEGRGVFWKLVENGGRDSGKQPEVSSGAAWASGTKR